MADQQHPTHLAQAVTAFDHADAEGDPKQVSNDSRACAEVKPVKAFQSRRKDIEDQAECKTQNRRANQKRKCRIGNARIKRRDTIGSKPNHTHHHGGYGDGVSKGRVDHSVDLIVAIMRAKLSAQLHGSRTKPDVDHPQRLDERASEVPDTVSLGSQIPNQHGEQNEAVGQGYEITEPAPDDVN